jgi:hypothetical protein
MKKKIKYGVIGLLGITFCTYGYLNYDNIGFYYGLDCTFCKKEIPFNIRPNFYDIYPQQFVMIDRKGIELAGSGFNYYKSNFKIKNIKGYGYNDTSIVITATDNIDSIRYLISYQTSYKSDKDNTLISFRDLNNTDLEKIKKNYQWYEFHEEKINTIRFVKFMCVVGTLLSLFFIIRMSLRW